MPTRKFFVVYPQKTLPCLGTILAIYALVCWVLWPYYRYQLNPDAVAYLDISRAVYEGNGLLTLSSFWSPLISWLIAPFLGLGLQGHDVFRVINILSGGLASWAMFRIARRFGLKGQPLFFLSIAACWLWIGASLTILTPDLLAAAFAILALNNLLNAQQQLSISSSIFILLSIFAKTYNLLFWLIWLGIQVLRNKSYLIKNLRYVWVLLIPLAYQFTAIWLNPDAGSVIEGAYRLVAGQTFEVAVDALPVDVTSAWTLPGLIFKRIPRPSFEAYYENLGTVIRLWLRIIFFTAAPLLLLIKRQWRILGLWGWLYPVGYLLFVPYDRFFMVSTALSLILGFLYAYKLKNIWRWLSFCLVLVVVYHPVRQLGGTWRQDEDTYNFAQQMWSWGICDGFRFYSDANPHGALHLAYLTRNQYLGVVKPDALPVGGVMICFNPVVFKHKVIFQNEVFKLVKKDP